MDGIVDLFIHLRGDLLIVYIQGGLMAGARGGSTGGAAGGTHLAFFFCITDDIQPGLQVEVLVVHIIILVPFGMTEGDLPELLQGGPGLQHQFAFGLVSSTTVGSLVGSRTFRTLSLSQKISYSVFLLPCF